MSSSEELTTHLNDVQRCVYELRQTPAKSSVAGVVDGVRALRGENAKLRAERDALRKAILAEFDVAEAMIANSPSIGAGRIAQRLRFLADVAGGASTTGETDE